MRPSLAQFVATAFGRHRTMIPSNGTLVEDYLAARGLTLPMPSLLCFHRELKLSESELTRIAYALDPKRIPQTDGYLVRCPYHEDTTASVLLRRGKHGILATPPRVTSGRRTKPHHNNLFRRTSRTALPPQLQATQQ